MAAKKGFKKLCPDCNTLIGVYGFNSHIKTCNGLGLSQYKRRNTNPLPPGRKRHYFPRGWVWNKGLTKFTDSRVKKCGETYSRGVKEGRIKQHNQNPSLRPEVRMKISETVCRMIAEGKHVGRCKKIIYDSPQLGVVNLHGT